MRTFVPGARAVPTDSQERTIRFDADALHDIGGFDERALLEPLP